MPELPDDEIRAILAACMGYDNRRPGQVNIAAWTRASDIGRWTLGEALDAVHQHYATTTEFLMPGHVTQRLRANRRADSAPRPGELQLPTAPPATDQRIRDAIAQVAANLGWTQRNTTRTDPELDHACPHERCHAGPGRPCGYRLTRGAHAGEFRPIHGYHPSRTQTAQETSR